MGRWRFSLLLPGGCSPPPTRRRVCNLARATRAPRITHPGYSTKTPLEFGPTGAFSSWRFALMDKPTDDFFHMFGRVTCFL